MGRNSLLIAAMAVSCALPAGAAVVENRRANITGGGGDGKCTIEVEVDDVAEVEVFGDQARIRTLSGSPSNFRRFQCNYPMPRNPNDFRFRGIDGRGRVDLIGDPRNSGGRAVVRIQDNKGGREGYTFDLEWRGGSDGGYSDGGGFPRGPRGDGGGYNSGPGRGGGGNRFTMAQAINVCKDAVRDRAYDEFGVRDIEFTNVDPDNNPGRNDYVIGSFVGRHRNNSDHYSFSCSVDFSTGRVRTADIRRR